MKGVIETEGQEVLKKLDYYSEIQEKIFRREFPPHSFLRKLPLLRGPKDLSLTTDLT